MAFFEDVYRTARELQVENPIIPLGDIWIEKDTGKAKRGDGAKAWNDLPYWAPGGGGSGGGAVDSVNGQTGEVVLDAEDVGAAATSHTHSAGQVTGLATVATSGSYDDLDDTPTLGTAAAQDTSAFDAAGAAASAQAAAVQRANHTGTQAISTVTNLQSTLDGKAASVHSHAAADVTSGTLAIARIPTGTTGSTVALGNHTHSGMVTGQNGVTGLWQGTETEYGAIAEPDANVVYVVLPDA